MVAQGCKIAITMCSTVMMARLLSPQDFGLVGMIMPVTGFMSLFQNLGLSMATVQRDEITNAQISTLFWLNIGISVLITVSTCILGPVASWFYGEPALTKITAVLASGFLLGGLSIQHLALLKRNMRLNIVAFVEIMSLLVGTAIGVMTAIMGAGYWSLVLIPLVVVGVSSTLYWREAHWRPGWPVRNCGIKGMVTFGSNLTGFNLLNYLARNMDNVLIGRYWGTYDLGLYTRAYGLLLLPMRQIVSPFTSVVVPGLSSLQKNPEAFRRYYLNALSLLAMGTVPLVVLLFLIADEIVVVLLGERWAACSTIFRCLALAAFLLPISNSAEWIYISLGRTRELLRFGSIGGILALASFACGLPFGANGVGLAYSIASLIWFIPNLHLAIRGTAIQMKEAIGVLSWPLLGATFGGTAVLAVRWYWDILDPFWSVVTATVVMTTIYGLTITRHIIRTIRKPAVRRNA